MRLRSLVILAAGVLVPALVALAMPSTSQEYLEAVNAKPDLDRGAHYFTSCANCHGRKGGGSVDGRVPRIGGQYFRVIVRQLVAYRHGRRWDMLMENFADQHRIPGAQAVADVAAYISQLEDPTPPGKGSGELLTHGARVYIGNCASCHGTSGQGDPDRVIPRLGGQHYEYLRRQMYEAVDGHRPAFPANHVRLLAQLEHDDIAAVADYLSRIAPRYADPFASPAAAR
ncbi:MAG TPA: c-type cytochrome [Steroidobacteraceae bacterium]